MLSLHSYKKTILFTLSLLLLIACGGGKSSPPKGQTTGGHGGSSDIINNMPGGTDLSTASATLKAIENTNNIEKVNASWLLGNWATYDDNGRSEKTTFTKDGRYQSENTLVEANNTEITKASGKWHVFKKTGTNRYHLFLTNNDNPLHLEDYPIEQVGKNAFRLIYQYQYPFSRSSLYSRLSEDYATYPGMHLIGTYTQAFAYRTGEDHDLSLTFNKNGSLKLEDFIHKFGSENELFSTQTGTWKLDTKSSKLVLTLNRNENYTLKESTNSSISLVDEDGNETYWEKTYVYFPDESLSHMEGEYQSLSNESYFSIKPNGEGYLIDYKYDYSKNLSFKDIPAIKLENGDLKLVYPAGHYNEGKTIILRAGYNRLYQIDGFTLTDYFQKVSKHPITKDSSSVTGSWRNTIFSASGFMSYVNFYDKGIFKDTDSYGDYLFDGNKLITKKTCKKEEVFYPSFSNNNIELDIPYSAVPGLRDWGKEGGKVGGLTFKHSLDVYQRNNSPLLKVAPSIKGGYLFSNNVTFSALITPSDYISFRLNSDGTGVYHSGILAQSGYDYSDNWREIPGSSFSFGIKYFIKQESGKEYIVYYPNGLVLINIDGKFTTIDKIKNANKDVRSAELYHRRTAICEDDMFVLPLSK